MAQMILGGVLGFGGGYGDAQRASREFQNQQRILEAQAGPVTTTRSPWEITDPMLRQALEAAGGQFNSNFTQNALRGVRGIPGASPETRNLLGEIEDRARNPSDTMNAANEFVQGRLAGGMNPISADLYSRLGNASFDRGSQLLMQFLGGGGGAGFDPWSGTDVLAGGGGPPGQDQVGSPRQPAAGATPASSGLRSAASAALSAKAASPAAQDKAKQQQYSLGSGASLENRAYQAAIDRGDPLPSDPRAYLSQIGKEGGGQQSVLAKRPGAAGAARTLSPPAAATAGGGNAGLNLPKASAAREIPDSMGVDSFFSDQVRQLFDPSRLDPANDPTMAPYIEALQADMEYAQARQNAEIGDRFSGLNSFNSSARALALGESSGQFDRALASELSRTYMGARESNLGRQMEALGMVSNRDLSAMGDRTQRYGIDTAARTAQNTASSAAANARALQEAQLGFEREALAQQGELANRGMNLDAIQAMIGMDQSGLGMLGGLGQQYDASQFGALSAVPGLEGVPLDYYGMAVGGRGGADALNQGAGLNRQQLDIQRRMGPATDLDAYLARIMGPATEFGTQVRQGTAPTGLRNPAPNPWVAGLLGAGGGVLANLGGGG